MNLEIISNQKFPRTKVLFFVSYLILVLINLIHLTFVFIANSYKINSFIFNVVQLIILILMGLLFYIKEEGSKVNARSHNSDNQLKYQKSGLTDAHIQELAEDLKLQIEKGKLYLNYDFNLTNVAKLLDISKHGASQIINKSFKMNFFELINKYRINEAKMILEDSNYFELNIEEIAFKSGFNNRVTFYKTFKKYYNTTPGEYRKTMS